VKAGWSTVTLDDACLIEYGTRVVQKKDGGSIYPVYGGGGATFLMDTFNRSNRLIVSRFGMSEQCTRFVHGDFFLNDSGLTVAPKSNYRLSQAYIDKHLLHLNDQIFMLGKGSAQKNLDVPAFRQLQINFPEDPIEQNRIVTLLDEAFANIATAKANAEKNLQNARELFESYLDASLGQRNESWTEKALQDIGSTQTGSTPKTSDQANYGNAFPFIKPGDFAPDGTLDYENDGLSAQGAANARKVSANSVLMVCIGATIGKCGYADREITTNQQINAFTPNAGVDKKFIYYQMLTKRFQDRVIHASGQATLPIINKSKWSALTVFLPTTLGEQEAIAQKLDAVREETQRLESISRQKLTVLDDLKKTLLHQAFSGQL